MGNSKSFKLFLCTTHLATLDSLSRKFLNHKSDTQSFDLLNSKSGQFPLLFCSMGHISTLSLHYSERSISQLSLIFFDAFCKPMPVTFKFSFSRIFFTSICGDVHQGIVFLLLHKIPKAFIATTHENSQPLRQNFSMYCSTSSVHSF